MIVIVISILLILIILNIFIFNNKYNLTNNTVDEYFNSAKSISDDKINNLKFDDLLKEYKKINLDNNNRGNNTSNTNNSGNNTSNPGNNTNNSGNNTNNPGNNLYDKKNINNINTNLYNEIDKIFTTKNNDQEMPVKSTSSFNDERIAIFDSETEGIKAVIKNKRYDKNNSYIRVSERDGYSDRVTY